MFDYIFKSIKQMVQDLMWTDCKVVLHHFELTMNSLTHSIIDELKIIYYLIFWAVYDFSEFTKRSCIITFQGIRNHILWVLWGLVSHWQRHLKM